MKSLILCIYICTDTILYTQYTYIHIDVFIYIYTHRHTSIFICIYIHIDIALSINLLYTVYIYICVCVRLCVFIYYILYTVCIWHIKHILYYVDHCVLIFRSSHQFVAVFVSRFPCQSLWSWEGSGNSSSSRKGPVSAMRGPRSMAEKKLSALGANDGARQAKCERNTLHLRV